MPTPTKPRRRSRPKKEANLDTVGVLLLSLLQDDCRRSDASLARILEKRGHGRSAQNVSERIKWLREHGYIKSMGAMLNPVRLGRGFTFFMAVRIHPKDEDTLQRFLKSIAEEDAILEVYSILGFCDYLMKVQAADTQEAGRISSRLMLQSQVRIETWTVDGTQKETAVIKLPAAPAAPSAPVSGDRSQAA